MVRTYGAAPYRAVLIHGGPGAPGGLACMGRELGRSFGVIEPLQSVMSIAQLVEELYSQIRGYCADAVTLIGHSWGAWLAVLTAQAHPDAVKRLILIGSGPFLKEYVPLIGRRRLENLSPQEGERFREAIARLDDPDCPEHDEALKTLGSLCDRADNVAPVNTALPGDQFPVNGEQYAAVWPEADELRANGRLYEALAQLHCPIVVIHGEKDPHPASGVIEPLLRQGADIKTHILPRCGHSPYQEEYAMKDFYGIIHDILKEDI